MFNLNHRVISMDRNALLIALRANRDKHAAEYTEAQGAFIERVEADLKAALKLMKKADFATASTISVKPKVPVSHLKEFDDAIAMLEYSQADTVEIDSTTFNAYVQNEWAWTNEFKSVLDSYKVAGSTFRG